MVKESKKERSAEVTVSVYGAGCRDRWAKVFMCVATTKNRRMLNRTSLWLRYLRATPVSVANTRFSDTLRKLLYDSGLHRLMSYGTFYSRAKQALLRRDIGFIVV